MRRRNYNISPELSPPPRGSTAKPGGGFERSTFIITYNGNLNGYAKELRKNQTHQEKKLWYCFLKDYEVRFKRQFVIGHYILDFYSGKIKLAIEIDGKQHWLDDAVEYDEKRRLYLESQGIKVIRFSNERINEKFELVCSIIDDEVRKRLEERDNCTTNCTPSDSLRSPAPPRGSQVNNLENPCLPLRGGGRTK